MIKDQDKSKRYVGVGVRVLVFNSDNQVLVGRRLDHKLKLYGSPGGHLEFGETFAQCAQRELKEEVNLDLDLENIKYVTTINVIKKEEGLHWLNIFMVARVDETQKQSIENFDKHACEEWIWYDWKAFMNSHERYHSFYYLEEQGYADINKIYKQCGIQVDDNKANAV